MMGGTGERDGPELHDAKKGPQKLAAYRVDRNGTGLPARPADGPVEV